MLTPHEIAQLQQMARDQAKAEKQLPKIDFAAQSAPLVMAAAQNVAAAAASGGSVLAEPPPAADPALEGPRMIRQYGGLSMIVPKAK